MIDAASSDAVAADQPPGTGKPSGTDLAARPDIDLRALFAPRSIAVVGASPRSDLAPTVRHNLAVMGSSTRIHFVNPKYDQAWDQPCFPDLTALPEVPDAVLIALNPLRAAAVTQQAADAGARAVLIPGGGVVEGGQAAAQMQRDVRDIALRHGLAVVGPNCMGVVDLTTRSALYIGDVNPWLPRGGVAGIAQSGSVADAFIHSGTRIGFSRIVSSGTEVVLDLCDFVAHSLDDPETHTIILFVEGFKRPERFLALADRALELGKPILAVKVGRSDQAQAAAVAHSGSIAGEDRVTDAALAAAGVVRCADLDELLEAAELHAGCRRMGRAVGRGRTGMVTVSTGEASLIADLSAETGLDLPPVPEAARAAILRDLPTMGYIGNPIDPWGAADEAICYPAVLRGFAESGAYDVLAIVHDFPYRSLPAEVGVARTVTGALIDATAGHGEILPVYVSLTSGEPTPEVQALLDEAGGVPLLRGAREAQLAIAGRAWWERRRGERLADGPARPTWPALASDRTLYGHDLEAAQPDPPVPVQVTVTARTLSERDSLALLRDAGVPVVDVHAATDPAGAGAIAARLGDVPLVLKLDAVGLAHKTDIGGVRLGLVGAAAVRAATGELLDLGRRAGLDVRGVLVEPMAGAGLELIVGMTRDALFGPALVVGFGGVLAELLDDVAIRLAQDEHGFVARHLLRETVAQGLE
ncbi:MAG: acetate--CoA ligase family protein, partial [Chloroflexota bacterium]|nr:acetate--CoA ligase family protein [Chloroflexota bacterium]